LRYLLHLANGCCKLVLLASMTLIIINRGMAALAIACALLAMILASLVEDARDRALMREIVNRLAMIVQTSKAAEMLGIDQALDAREARLNEVTVADEEI
jgi:hypothetical protein